MGSSDSISTTHHHVQTYCCPRLSRRCPGCCLCRAKVPQAPEGWMPLDSSCCLCRRIEDAWNNCWDAADIMSCINGIIGASDCGVCICDVLGWLGLMDC